MKKKLIEQPLTYWEEQSYMMIIPKKEEENLIKKAIERLTESKEFQTSDINLGGDGTVTFKILYEKEQYEIGFYLGGICVPEYYLHKNFLFKEEEKIEILNAKRALTMFMKFGNNVKKSFQLQLKIALTLIPNLIGILDESAEKMLPAKWVEMTATSQVLPSAKDLFNVQAISGKNKKIWLHTHGLCRCGISELEILESDQDHYQQHYNLMIAYGMFLIDNEEKDFILPKGTYIGHLINDSPVVVTAIPWTEGILEYKNLKLGNEKDRQSGHNTKTSIIFLYTSEEDEKNNILNKVSIYDKLWGDNPLFYFSDEETERMKSLAQERFFYVERSAQNKEHSILLKIGLPLKEKGKYEHIWFELLEIKGDKMKAKLTQEPYGISDIHTGYEAWYTVDDITDWLIYTKDFVVSPSDAYLLNEE